MGIHNKDMLLYAVTDRSWSAERNGDAETGLLRQVEEALKGGVTCLQLREKALSPDLFLAEALQMKELCQRYRVPFLINDDVEIALSCGADGVHVGQQDMQVERARQILGPDATIGVSVSDVAQALSAQADGADYLGVGAMFPTATKLDAEGVSFEALRDICNAVSIPVVAIGGIHEGNMAKLVGSGADGVALVSAIFASPDIEGQCRELRALAEKTFHPGVADYRGEAAELTESGGAGWRHGLRDQNGNSIEIKGAIFDLDGTLLDSMSIWDNIAWQYLVDRGIQPEEKINEKFRAMSLRQAALYYRAQYGLKEAVDEIEAGINGMIEDFYLHEAVPKQGVPELLQELCTQGVRMCVATATDRRLTEAALRRNGLFGYFVSIITCGEMGSGKNQPEIFHEALRRLGTDRALTPVFEDAAFALITAGDAGFPTVGVYDSSFADAQQEIQEKASLYIRSFRDLRFVAL